MDPFGKMCISDLTEKHIINKELSSTDLVEDATSRSSIVIVERSWSSKWCNYKDKNNVQTLMSYTEYYLLVF